MAKTNPLKKLALSSLVAFSFAAYVLHERSGKPQDFTVTPAGGKGFRQHEDPEGTSNVFPPPVRQPTAVPTLSPIIVTILPLASPTAVLNIVYQDGTFTGNVTDAIYGNVQVQATIQGGKITDVQFLEYPHDRRISQEINAQAMPSLKQEVIQAQNAQVDFVTGATLTSQAFVQSVQSALDKAKKQA